jgi:hypothetical protein
MGDKKPEGVPTSDIQQSDENGTEKAKQSLRDAIALHEQHMNGQAPTTGPEGEKSQMLMMEQMQDALAALEDDA